MSTDTLPHPVPPYARGDVLIRNGAAVTIERRIDCPSGNLYEVTTANIEDPPRIVLEKELTAPVWCAPKLQKEVPDV